MRRLRALGAQSDGGGAWRPPVAPSDHPPASRPQALPHHSINFRPAGCTGKEEGDAGDAAKPTEVAASHVLVAYKGASRADPSITRSKEEAKTRADSLRQQIVDEAKDFATVARENSDGPSKTKGGDLGKFTFETMAKAFSEAAFALDVGGVSEVVETPFGFHIIKRTE